jgi:hypothetical protein
MQYSKSKQKKKENVSLIQSARAAVHSKSKLAKTIAIFQHSYLLMLLAFASTVCA